MWIITGVDSSVLATDYKIIYIPTGESQLRDVDSFRLFVLQFERLLGLRQHVQTPGTHFAVSGQTD